MTPACICLVIATSLVPKVASAVSCPLLATWSACAPTRSNTVDRHTTPWHHSPNMAGQTHVTTTQTADNHKATFRHQDPWKPKHQRRTPRRGDQTPSRAHRRTGEKQTKTSQERNYPQHKGHLVQPASHPELKPRSSVSSQVAVTCGCNVLHVQSNDLETMASFTLSVHSSSTRMQAYLGCWSV